MICIENNQLIKLQELLQSEDKAKLLKILNNILHLNIKEMIYEKNIKLNNLSEYEFEMIKMKAILSTEEEIEIYLKMIKRGRVKESIFCYWCSIYEEELLKIRENENIEMFVNKVLISELNKKTYHQSIFLEIEDNKTPILETGTEVNFLEILKYIEENKNSTNKYEELYKYFEKYNDDVLLIGIKKEKAKIMKSN